MPPHDSLRSAVYKSFVTCDDPKGVVECRKIRKSRSKRLEDKIENRDIPKDSNSSSSYEEERKGLVSKSAIEDMNNPSSFQLMEVSRGAQKLNLVIDSWTKGRMSFDGDSKEIAKDLLKGALDLQESLVMLRKLQEASEYMAKLKKKQKVKSRGERIDEVGIERTNSCHFVDHSYQTGIQKPRLSSDGSSKDCFEELRMAIRDSLARQNLLPPERKVCCDRKPPDSDLDIVSTSSSQSSMVHSHDFTSSDSSLSSKAPKKSKGSNLIAKLMGLEEIPSQAAQKISSQRRAMFDIDMPKARKPQSSAAHKVDIEERKLNKIVETMQSKGLLKSNRAEEFWIHSHHSIISNSKRSIDGDAPPIVIMKPLPFSSDMFRRFKIKGEETAVNRLSKVGDKSSKEVQSKPEETAAKTHYRPSSNKLKASVTVNQQQKKEPIEKKVDRVQKMMPRKNVKFRLGDKESTPAEMESVKSKAVTKYYDQAKAISTKERKSDSGFFITRIRTSQQKATSSSVISKHATPDLPLTCGERRKNVNKEKPVKEPFATNIVVENVVCKFGDKLIDFSCEDEYDTTRISTTTGDQLLTEEWIDASEIQIKEQFDGRQSSLCDNIPQTSQHESYEELTEEPKYCISQNRTEKKYFRTETYSKDLFLSSPSFLSHAEKLFDIDVNQAITSQTTQSNNPDDTRLLLDCADELMQHKSLRHTQTIHPLSHTPVRKNSKTSVSLAQLVEELWNGIESLSSYNKFAGEKLLRDGLFVVLERDLLCPGVANGVWELGWRDGFSMDETEQVVGDIEKLVFSELIKDVFTDSFL